MRCKIITVPLEPDNGLDRERKLNEFLSTTNVKRVFASVASPPRGPMWSVMFFYEEDGVPSFKSMQTTQNVRQAPSIAAPVASATPVGSQDSGPPLTTDQVKWVIALKRWRAEQAEQEGVPLYMVAQNKWLEEIVRMPARGLDDLLKVRGLGEWRVQKYGTKILEAMNGANSARRSWPSASFPPGRA